MFAMRASVWSRERPAAPPRETLSRGQIVQAALEMLDADGLAGLSMRKLGAKLNAGATSLYWHVQTKDDLLELVADEVYSEIDVPGAELAGWRSAVTLFGHSFRAAILRHPWFTEIATTTPSLGPNAISLSGRLYAVLRTAGFTGLDVDMAMGVVITYVLGVTSAETSWRAAIARSGQSMREWIDDATAKAVEVSRDNAEIQESLRARRGADPELLQERMFTFGLECVLDGFAARVGS
jgi:AcrR family transcriptional regulator